MSVNMNHTNNLNNIVLRGTIYALIMGSVFMFFSIMNGADGGASEGFDYASFRGNAIFWVFTSVNFFVMAFCREASTRVSAMYFMGISIAEAYLYFALHAAFAGNIYLSMMVQPLLTGLSFYLFKNKDFILMNLVMLLVKFPSGTVRRLSLSMMLAIKPNYLSLMVTIGAKYYFMVGLAMWAIYVFYAYAMQIPSTGYIWGVIEANNHFPFYYLSFIADDLVGLYMMTVLIMSFLKEAEHTSKNRIY